MSSPTRPIPWRGALSDSLRDSLPRCSTPLANPDIDWTTALSDWQGQSRRLAAVALLLVEGIGHRSGPADVVLTRRSADVGSHKRQISLAGGRREIEDASPARTAKRECMEELGLLESELVVHGVLPALPALDLNPVVPVLMTASRRPLPEQVAPEEVEALHFMPWTSLEPEHRRVVEFNLFGIRRRTYLFEQGELRCWGLTAQILAQAQFHL